jgi:hypothetical protein
MSETRDTCDRAWTMARRCTPSGRSPSPRAGTNTETSAPERGRPAVRNTANTATANTNHGEPLLPIDARENGTVTSAAIQFTQYKRPNGRAVPVWIERPAEIAAKADAIIARGLRFECEHLTTGDVSLTITDPDEGDIDIEVVANGPDVPLAVDRLILRQDDAALTDAEQKAQGARCGCKGVDDYCVCQNVPDSTTRKERAMHPANESEAGDVLTEIAEENEAMREDEFNALGPGDDDE